MAETTSGQTSLGSLEDAFTKAKAAAKALGAERSTYENAYKDIDKELIKYGIPTGKFGGTGSPGEIREVQLKSLSNIALTNPALAEQLRAKIEDRAKNALVYEEKNKVANKAFKDVDTLEEELDTQRGLSSTGAVTSPPPASAAPGNPTDYTPAPTPPLPETTTNTATAPSLTLAQAREANSKIIAEKGDPVRQQTDPNNPDIQILTFSDGTTGRRAQGRRGVIVLDAPQPTAPLNAAAQQQADLAKQKKEEAAQYTEQSAIQKAQVEQSSKELDAALATGDKEKIAAAQLKYEKSREEWRATLNTESDLKSDASLAERRSIYLNSIKNEQQLANETTGGGLVAPTPVSGEEALQATQDAEATQLANQEGIAFAPSLVELPGDEALQATQDAEAAALANQEGSAFAPPVELPGDEALQATQDAEAAALANQEGSAFAPPINPNTDPEVQAIQDALDAQLAEQEGSAFAEIAQGSATLTEQEAINRAIGEQAADAAADAGFTNGGVNKLPETSQFAAPPDWRFRISLAPGSNYFYNTDSPGILLPLKKTKGVIFPYTPAVSVAYTARYDTTKITHSNYDFHNYQGSSVENITVAGDFTAQDVTEANYLLAVIHFFKTATKMFYGRDQNPNKGTPPPLLYLSGFGQYQFDSHPVVLTGFTYSLPVDVDYINAYPNGVSVGVNGAYIAPYQPQTAGGNGKTTPSGPIRGAVNTVLGRLAGSGVAPGGKKAPSVATSPSLPTASNEITRVPTKMNIQLTLLPIITRKAISNEFSLKAYATGELLRGSKNPRTGGGLW